MEKFDNFNVLSNIEEIDEKELDSVLGAGKHGVLYTVSHECNMNTWQFAFTCCSH